MADKKLTRQVDFTVTETGDGLTLEGYAAVFNTPTRIDSWEGQFDEVIAPGAFKRTIDRKGPAGIRLQFNHGQDTMFGELPIGAIEELREDARGLYVRARLHDNWFTQPIRDAIASGAVSGMSFRFVVHNDEMDRTGAVDLRSIREVELFEVGPVVWPAYADTTVAVRSVEQPNDPAPLIRALLHNHPDVRAELEAELAVRNGPTDAPTVADGPADVLATDDAPPSGPRRDLAAERAAVLADLRGFISERKDAE